jgi:tetratricopeptide (TPR) repeat protein
MQMSIFRAGLVSLIIVSVSWMVCPGQALDRQKAARLSGYLLETLPPPECSFLLGMQKSDFDTLLSGNLDIKLRACEIAAQGFGDRNPVEKADILHQAGRLALALGYDERGERYLQAARDIYLENFDDRNATAELHTKIGRVLSALDHEEEAERYFRRAIEKDRDYYPAYLELLDGMTIWDWRQYLQLKQQCDQLLDRSVSRSRYEEKMVGELCYSYYWCGVQTLLVDMVIVLIDQGVNESVAVDSVVKDLIGKWMEAFLAPQNLELLEMAVRTDTNDVRFRGTLAAVQVGQVFYGLLDDALSDTASLELEIEMDGLLRHLSVRAQRQSDVMNSARCNLDWIVDNWGDDFPVVYYYYALLEMQSGDVRQADSYIRKAIELDPDDFRYHSFLCGLYVSGGGVWTGEDLRWFEDALARKCQDYPTGKDCYRIGVIHCVKGEYAYAESAFRASMEAEPEYLNSQIALGVVLLVQGNLEDAKSVLKPLRLSPQRKASMSGKQLGCLYLCLGVLAELEEYRNLAAGWYRKAVPIYEELSDSTFVRVAETLLQSVEQ